MSYISLKRSLANHHLWLAEPFSRGQAWIDILFQTNFKPSHIYVRGIRLEIARGQLVWSQDAMATRWKWGRKKVSAFLLELEGDQRITRQRHDRIDVITICNYSQYQSATTNSGTTNDTTNGTTNRPHLNKGNEWKEKNPLTPKGDVFVFPDWLPLEDWQAFVEMRKAIKKPMTDRAVQMIITKLSKMKGSPSAILQQSTINNWQDVFEPRENKPNPFDKPKPQRAGVITR